MRIRYFIALLVLLAVSALTVGCGSSDSTAGTTDSVTVTADESLTKAELIKQGDEICKKADEVQTKELNAYLKKNPKAESSKSEQAKLVLAAGLPAVKTEIEELAALGAPSDDVAEVQAIIEGFEKALAEGEKAPSSLLGETNNPFTAVNGLAGEYGFKVCNSAL
jgi:hypothetical protein